LKKKYEIYRLADRGTASATIRIDAPNFTGAEQDIIALDEREIPIAVIQLQPGFDRREVACD
jgi:hypothetical protein